MAGKSSFLVSGSALDRQHFFDLGSEWQIAIRPRSYKNDWTITSNFLSPFKIEIS
jgi:hypothetical protein